MLNKSLISVEFSNARVKNKLIHWEFTGLARCEQVLKIEEIVFNLVILFLLFSRNTIEF